MARAVRIPPGQEHDLEDRQVDLDAPELPVGIRAAALKYWQDGYSLWRCPRSSGPRGLLGMGQAERVIEWWLLDADGQLIEAFWETYSQTVNKSDMTRSGAIFPPSFPRRRTAVRNK